MQLLSYFGAEYCVYLRRFRDAYASLDRAIQRAPDADNTRAVKSGDLINEGLLAEVDREITKFRSTSSTTSLSITG